MKTCFSKLAFSSIKNKFLLNQNIPRITQIKPFQHTKYFSYSIKSNPKILFKYSKFHFFGSKPNTPKKDYYKILDLNKSATSSDIKKQYFKLAKEWHPDRNKDPKAKEKFAELSEYIFLIKSL